MLHARSKLHAAMALSVALVAGLATSATAQTLTKQFTYQGYIEHNGQPYSGNAAINFGLHSALTGGSLRDNLTLTNIPVDNGIFTVLLNFGETDFLGDKIYDGRPLYLGLSVDTGEGVFQLSPRQSIQPTPYALAIPNVTPHGTNVGIGTTNPTVKLHVRDSLPNILALEGTSTSGSYLTLNNTSAGGKNWSFISTGSANGEGAGKLLIGDQSVRMTFDTNGNLGIGTTAPTDRLTVNGTAKVLGNTTVVGTFRHASDASANPTRTLDISSGGGVNLISNSDLYILPRGGRKHTLINTDSDAGNVGIGTSDPTSKLHVNGNIRAKVIIIEGGADLAESYDVASEGDLTPMPGMVVTIDPDQIGKLRIASGAYDRKVAGIISGADGVAPGLILGQKGTVADGALPIANAGRVWCYVDADAGGPVVPGDLLTTSDTPGHAMKASDSTRASGATMGKAMSKLESGRGLVLVLVTLQ